MRPGQVRCQGLKLQAQVVDLCVRYADEVSIAALAPSLSSLLRTAVGLPSRAGVARFISQLCLEHTPSMKAFAGKLAKTLVAVLRVEPSVPLQRAFGSSLAGCCRLATRPAVAAVCHQSNIEHAPRHFWKSVLTLRSAAGRLQPAGAVPGGHHAAAAPDGCGGLPRADDERGGSDAALRHRGGYASTCPAHRCASAERGRRAGRRRCRSASSARRTPTSSWPRCGRRFGTRGRRRGTVRQSNRTSGRSCSSPSAASRAPSTSSAPRAAQQSPPSRRRGRWCCHHRCW